MSREPGLRVRKKAQTRDRLADVAARLFALHGYDAVSIVDVARAADVSDQTVYNYFSSKQELVLDRAEQIRERLGRVVVERPPESSPARALQVLVDEDIERFRQADRGIAAGEFPAQCVGSPVLRRYALEMREQHADTVSTAILETDPGLHALVVRAHAAALVWVIQSTTDRIGANIIAGSDSEEACRATAAQLTRAAHAAFDDLDRHFRSLTTGKPTT